jgi:hypothetical protein
VILIVDILLWACAHERTPKILLKNLKSDEHFYFEGLFGCCVPKFKNNLDK